MTLLSEPDAAPSVPQPADGQDVPARVAGLELLGEVSGSGYRTPPSLVRHSDGQTVQLTKLLYLVLEAIDGARDNAAIAASVAEAVGRPLGADDVEQLIQNKLRPMGLVANADGSQVEVTKPNPLLALRFRFVVSNTQITRRVTAPFAVLFHPIIVIPMLAAFGYVCYRTFFELGLAAATHQAFDRPALLLAVFALGVLSAGFHEFGHASAARYGGATPGAMGAGLYIVWPAFYTDVSDSYRLGRAGRVRTDLGGIYFNAIFTIAAFGGWWISGHEALLLIIPLQLIQMVQQLTPLLRFDGYHILADLTGVPDLYQRIKPTLLGLLPHRWNRPESKVLKPWARAVVTLWVVLIVPLLLLIAIFMVLALPRVLATAARSIRLQSNKLGSAFTDANAVDFAVSTLSLIAVAIPALGMTYMAVRIVRQLSVNLWRASPDRPWRQRAARVTAFLVIAGLAHAWWPSADKYRPVEAYERGTVADAVSVVAEPRRVVDSGRQGQGTAVWAADAQLPTRERPMLAVVMVPVGNSEAPTWVFPFNRPLPPGSGDNQALAVNTTDGSVVYKVSFALVWARDGEVLNTNEAYAFASCEGCAAVAVGFQVIMVVGEVDVAVPQNLAGAVNFSCISCVSYALATQLVITLPGELSEAAMGELAVLWQEIAAFGENITDVPLAELQSHFDDFKARIVDIIQRDTESNPALTAPAPSVVQPAPSEAPAAPDAGVATTAADTPPETTTSQPVVAPADDESLNDTTFDSNTETTTATSTTALGSTSPTVAPSTSTQSSVAPSTTASDSTSSSEPQGSTSTTVPTTENSLDETASTAPTD